MLTRVIRIDPAAPDEERLREAAALLHAGALVAFPTETVYGLGANALDPEALRRIYAVKGRPASNPLIAHGASLQAFADLIGPPPEALVRLTPFWPGPLTVVLPASPRAPKELSAGRGTVALRIPDHPVALALLEVAGIPLAAPSANSFSRPSPTQAEHVLADLGGAIPLVIDAGETPVGIESSVVDLTVEPPALLRPGALAYEELRKALPGLRLGVPHDSSLPPASPGLSRRHYSPRAPLFLYLGPDASVHEAIRRDAEVQRRAGRRVGLLATDSHCRALCASPLVIHSLGPDDALEIAASRLFSCLRAFDDEGIDRIYAVGVAESGMGRALLDRLTRAADGKVVVVGEQGGT